MQFLKFVTRDFVFFWAWAYATWFLFLAIMSLKQARDAGKLPTASLVLGYPIALVGWVFDFLLNMMATLLFLELPREWLLTIRCDRLMTNGSPWRAHLAWTICAHLLDPFQVGGHCHKLGE